MADRPFTFAGHQFLGRISFDAFWAVDPEKPYQDLPQPWQIAARWCNRCWRLIPNGQKAYDYGGFDMCRPCHLVVVEPKESPT